uniref:Uncharacterized protein n=1 Tax=Glossina austeni TaxID=7395 RepID=A0A1A9V4I8_GLOAU
MKSSLNHNNYEMLPMKCELEGPLNETKDSVNVTEMERQSLDLSTEGRNMPDQIFDADEISNALIDENMENEWISILNQLTWAKQLELHFTQADRSIARATRKL